MYDKTDSMNLYFCNHLGSIKNKWKIIASINKIYTYN